MELHVRGPVVEWRGPAPYYYVSLSHAASADVREAGAALSYGWGVVPVAARIGEVGFTTSLFPKDGRYLLPLRLAVRRPLGLVVGDTVDVVLELGRP